MTKPVPPKLFVSGIGVGFGNALMATVAITGVHYTLSSWRRDRWLRSQGSVDASRDPASGIPFGFMAQHFGDTIGDLANILLLTSVFAALLHDLQLEVGDRCAGLFLHRTCQQTVTAKPHEEPPIVSSETFLIEI